MIRKAPKITKAAKMARATKFVKAAKFAKVAVVLGVALAVVELVVELATAGEINAQLRKDRKKLEDSIREADQLLAEMSTVIAEAETMVNDLLAEAGFGGMPIERGMEAFVAQINEAIAGLGKQKAVARMVPRMALLGLPSETIAAASELDAALVENLLAKLDVERALASGQTEAEVAEALDMTPEQVAPVAALVQARGAVLAGDVPEAVAEATGVPLPVVSGEADENIRRAAPHWREIQAGGDLAALTDQVLVFQSALGRVRRELVAKTALAGGADISDLAGAIDVSVETVSAWGVALAEARSEIELILQPGSVEKPEELAVSLRVPIRLIG